MKIKEPHDAFVSLFLFPKGNVDQLKHCIKGLVSLIRDLFKSTKQKQPSRDVPIKRCSENMQQIYRKTPMPKCDFNKVALQL